MIGRGIVAATAFLTAPVLLAVTPAQAFTARQATSQGQGVFVTSSGTPQNIIPGGPVTRQDDNERRPLRAAHHDRYFAGF